MKNKFGVNYTASGITNLLERLGFVYKKPNPNSL
ncbi:MAG: winged helix-turn-helix domain-containing protein [Polaribacter sp.]